MLNNKVFSDLFIIGNGFDIHHGLPSKYTDFQNWLCNNRPELYNKLSKYYACSGQWWNAFEESLGYPKLHEFIMDTTMCNQPNLLAEKFHDVGWCDGQYQAEQEIGCFVDELCDSFSDWVKAELSNCPLDNKLKIRKEKSFFINFNYTDILEKVYGISKNNIWHPHGSLNDGNIIVGHGRLYKEIMSEYEKFFDISERTERTTKEDYEKLLSYVDANKNIIYEIVRETAISEISKLKKPVSRIINVNISKFKRLRGVKRIHVYGLSLSNVDIKYFETIKKYSSSFFTIWEFSYHSPDDEKRIKEVKRKLRICPILTRKIKLEYIQEYRQLRLF